MRFFDTKPGETATMAVGPTPPSLPGTYEVVDSAGACDRAEPLD